MISAFAIRGIDKLKKQSVVKDGIQINPIPWDLIASKYTPISTRIEVTDDNLNTIQNLGDVNIVKHSI
jgi:hypothetical protein